jgi:hypothetical protein
MAIVSKNGDDAIIYVSAPATVETAIRSLGVVLQHPQAQ